MDLRITLDVNLTGDVLSSLLANSAAILKGITMSQETLDALKAEVAALKKSADDNAAAAAAANANTDKILQALLAAKAGGAGVSDAELQGLIDQIAPVNEELAATTQALKDTTAKDQVPADPPAPTPAAG